MGVVCGILIFAVTNSITSSVKEFLIKSSSQPVITNQVELSKDQTPEPKDQTKETSQSTYESTDNYTRYWQSNGIKFKDVGENGIEKTYVWNASLKKWIDTGCVGNFE